MMPGQFSTKIREEFILPSKVKFFIVCQHFLDEAGRLVIGGLEKYIADLGEILSEAGHEVTVYQYAKENSSAQFRSFTVERVKAGSSGEVIRFIDAKGTADYSRDILVFATDFLIVPGKFRHVIAVQHGVAWDEAETGKKSALRNYAYSLKCALRAIVKNRRYRYCSELICVDYNFMNWYRTQVKAIPFHLQCIPNYSQVPPSKPDKDSNNISIVFARRLVYYRGTRFFL